MTAPWSSPSRIVPGANLWRGCRIGLLGGSFNPPHGGHLHISRLALKRLALDSLWWLVSPQNPLKAATGMAPFESRLAAARERAAGRRIMVTDIERRLGTRFTVDTVGALQASFPGTRFVWLMGADNLMQIPRWHRWAELFENVPIAIFDRPAYAREALAGKAAERFRDYRIGEDQASGLANRAAPAWLFARIRTHPASSSEIRRRAAD